ncbi:hypothetical protein VTL71DRAFT_5763 [Oculimacula yallundae]|uniref:Uncharacterized protein n=1 Tax=Oculimacula yallundae TaxID=86028 RepID=A0ABR4BZL9_9HELO
MVTPIASSFE